MRWPSTSTRLCADLVPRMKTPGKLPRPPVGATCTPGTRLSRSVTLVGCRRSMSARVNTVLAALLSLRAWTWRLALITTSESFRAWSRVSASRSAQGSSSRARHRRFMGCPWHFKIMQNHCGSWLACDNGVSDTLLANVPPSSQASQLPQLGLITESVAPDARERTPRYPPHPARIQPASAPAWRVRRIHPASPGAALT